MSSRGTLKINNRAAKILLAYRALLHVKAKENRSKFNQLNAVQGGICI